MKNILRTIFIFLTLVKSYAQTTPQPCNATGKVAASTTMEVYLGTALCTLAETFKNDDGSFSPQNAERVVEGLKNAISTNPAFAGVVVNFPASNADILAALAAGNCQQAAQTLASGFSGDIDVEKYNEDILGTYDDIFDNLLPKELELSMTTEQPSCSLPNGKITITVKNGTPPFQYSIDGGANWSSPTSETSYTFVDLTASQYAINVKDSESNIGKIGVELKIADEYLIPVDPVVAIASTPNARIAAYSTAFCIAYTSNNTSHCFQFKLGFGFTPPSANNNFTLTISKAPDRFSSVLGSYIPLFKESDPNILLGFYKSESHPSSPCTHLSAEATINSKCSLLCDQLLLPKSVFVDIKPGLFLNDHIGGRYTPEISAIAEEVDELVTEFMNNEQYVKLIRNVKSGAYTEQELISLRKTLIDYKELMLNTYGEANSKNLQNFINFFTCNNVPRLCNTNDGVVPACWWQFSPPASQIPFQSGFIDGAADLAGLVIDLDKFTKCWLNPLKYFWDNNSECETTRKNSLSALQFTLDLSSGDPDAATQFVSTGILMNEILSDKYGIWKNEVGPCENVAPVCCEYRRGKLAFDMASLLVGTGEFQAVRKGFSLGSKMVTNLTRASSLLKFIKFPTKVLSLKAIRQSTGKGLSYLMLMASLSVQQPAVQTGIKVLANETKAAVTWVVEASGIASEEVIGLARAIEVNAERAGVQLVGEADNLLLRLNNQAANIDKLLAYNVADKIIFGKQASTGFETMFAFSPLAGLARIPPDDTPENCETCSPSKNMPKRLCAKLEQLKIKGGTNGTAGVHKLCSSLDNTALEAVADELLLNRYSNTEVLAFLGDIAGSVGTIHNNVSILTAEIIATWKYLYTKHATKAPNARKDWNTLVQFGKLDNSIKNYIILYSDAKLITFCADLDKPIEAGSSIKFIDFVNDPNNLNCVKYMVQYHTSFEEQEELSEEYKIEASLQSVPKKWVDNSTKTQVLIDNGENGRYYGKRAVVALLNGTLDLGITGIDQSQYKIFREVELFVNKGTNPPQYMIADILLVKFNALGQIDDVIICESKLSAGAEYTKRQKQGWRIILEGGILEVKAPSENVLIGTPIPPTFNRGGVILPATTPLRISLLKAIKIYDTGDKNGVFRVSNIPLIQYSTFTTDN